jgi:tripartite ATP-independent transporter DctM subunit
VIILLFVLLASLIFISYPIAFAIGIASIIVMQFLDLPMSMAITQTFGGIDSFSLMAIPFFILAGQIMGKARIVEQIVDFANSLVGRLRGGLGHVNILASMIFSGVSGSGVADASAIGSLLIPSMVKQGYAKDFSVAVTASSATIGPIIPPSIPLILYGILTRQSIGRLFLGGVIPGLLIGFGLMGMNYIVCVKRNYIFRQEKTSVKGIIVSFFRSSGALIMPVIIIGGITSGLFTATEAGVIAVVYGFFFGMLITRSLKFNHIPKVLIDSATTAAIVMYIIAMATIFSNILSRLRFQHLVVDNLLSFTGDPTLAVLLIIVFLLFLGLFIDPTAVIVMFAPTLADAGAKLGFDPIHFGVLMIVVMLIGAVTPPVGSMLFISCSIAKISIEESFIVLVPFILVLILVALVVLFIPQTAVWLPRIFLP